MTFHVLLFADETPACTGALIPLYGVSMLERQVRLFASLGARSVTVIGSSAGGGDRIQEHLGRLDAAWIAPVAPVAYRTPGEPPAGWLPSDALPVLLVDAHQLYDARILAAIVRHGPNTLAVDPEAALPCHLALLDADTLERLTRGWSGASAFWKALLDAQPGTCRSLDLRQIDTYVVNLRRSIPPYWLPVTSSADARAGETRLIDAAQKGTLDWPAQYLHPPAENWMTRQIAQTGITPNQVTTFTNLIAFAAAGLLAAGFLVSGLLVAVLVGILDGVDGKLARVTVRCTRFGDRFEHILDNVYELSWYWALGWVLSGGGADALPLMASGVVTLFYLLDRAATGLFKYRRGIELFDYAPADRFFRRIGGRRNIYVLMLLAGVLCRLPLLAFEAVAVWAVVTAVFHWTRALWLLRQHAGSAQASIYSGEAAS